MKAENKARKAKGFGNFKGQIIVSIFLKIAYIAVVAVAGILTYLFLKK